MTPDLVIREATADDADALIDLYTHLSPEQDTCPPNLARQNIRQIAQITGSAILIGSENGTFLTSCTLIVVPNLTRGGAPYALIENVVTRTGHRGQGLGTAILDAACDRAWRHGCYKIMLSTGSANPATHAFYENAGFEQSRIGFQKRRVPKRVEPGD